MKVPTSLRKKLLNIFPSCGPIFSREVFPTLEEGDLELLVPALEECHEVAVAQARLPLQLSSRVFALRNIVFWSRSVFKTWPEINHNKKVKFFYKENGRKPFSLCMNLHKITSSSNFQNILWNFNLVCVTCAGTQTRHIFDYGVSVQARYSAV